MKRSALANASIRGAAVRAKTTPARVRREIAKVIIAAQTNPFPSKDDCEIRMLTLRLGRLPSVNEVVLHMIDVEKNR